MSTGSPDPKWRVVDLSTDSRTRASSAGLTPPYPAFDIGSGSINFLNGCCYTDFAGEVQWMTMQRCFYLCSATSVTFNLTVTNDDWATDFYVDATPLCSASFPQPPVGGAGMAGVAFVQAVSLGAGWHCISIKVHNYNYAAPQAFWLNISGTISTPGPYIVMESGTCNPSSVFCSIPPIIGADNVCVNKCTTLSNAFAGGTWSSSNPGIAAINPSTGEYCGINPGNATITYTDPCGRTTTMLVTVKPLPIVSITNSGSICSGDLVTITAAYSLSGGTVIAGTWSGPNLGCTSCLPSTTATPVSAPSATYALTLTGSNSCTTTATNTVTVWPLPVMYSVTGGGIICPGSPGLPIGLNNSQTGINYTLYNGTTVVSGPVSGTGGPLAFGIFTTPGTYTIKAINTTTGCSRTMYGSAVITAGTTPVFTPTYAPIPLCTGTLWTLHNNLIGTCTSCTYAWSGPGGFSSASADPSMPAAAMSMTGIYSLTLTSGGCIGTNTVNIIVNPLPGLFNVTGGGSYCAGGGGLSIDLDGSESGVNYQLLLGGVALGTPVSGTGAPITFGLHTTAGVYTIEAINVSTGCTNNMTGSATIVVNPLPVITPSSVNLCVGETTTLSTSLTGGTWVSSNTAVATIPIGSGGSTEVLTAVGPGLGETITYTSPAGCIGMATVNVYPNPDPIPATDVCEGSSVTLSAIPAGGTWTSLTPALATVSGAGVVTGTSAGAALIDYSIAPIGCSSTASVTVKPTPAISYPVPLCTGNNYPATVTITGGTYTSSAPTVATVDAATGLLSTLMPGTTTITYTAPDGCTANVMVMVNLTPSAFTVTGGGSFCAGDPGVPVGLSSSEIGIDYQLYRGSTPVGPPVAGTGSAISFGLQTVAGAYTVLATNPGSLCAANMTGSATVVVLPVPTLSYTPPFCVGYSYPATVSISGGTFSSASPTVAGVDPVTGLLSCLTPGSTVITYTSADGCTVTFAVSVNATPEPLIGKNYSPSPDLCIGQSTNIYIDPSSVAAFPGCTYYWTSSAPLVADVDPATATSYLTTITGYSAGTATITCYVTSAAGCAGVATFVVTIHPDPVVTISSSPVASGTPPVVRLCEPPGTLTATASDPSTFLWTATATVIGPGTMIPASGIGPVISVDPPVTTAYSVTATSTWGCKGSASITVETGRPCLCEAIANGVTINQFGPIAPSSSATFGTVSTAVGPGSYFMNNDVQISGTVIMTDVVLFIAPGYKIEVLPTARLILRHCHLFCCPGDMWKGILLDRSGIDQGRIELTDNTMIEDAIIAIDAVSPTTPAGYTTGVAMTPLSIINSSGAIFNKNQEGIHITTYQPSIVPLLITTSGVDYPTPLMSCYPFLVENTVFTSRDFYSYSPLASPGYTDKWPFRWAPTTNLKQAWTTTPSPYDPPYNIDNLSACPTGPYPYAACNMPGVVAEKGIDVQDVGIEILPATTASGNFAGLVTGSLPTSGDNNELNMFDNLRYGIYAENSNVVVRNSVFQHIQGSIAPVVGGTAIFATNTNPVAPGNEYKLWVYGSDGSTLLGRGGPAVTSSSFYDCITGIETREYYSMNTQFATMMSSHSCATAATLGMPAGSNGILASGAYYSDIQLNYNNIYNISHGISFLSHAPVSSGSGNLHGQITVKNNNIWANKTGTTPLLNEYVRRGITVGSSAADYGLTIVSLSQVNIDKNDLKYVFNGIRTFGFDRQVQPVTNQENTIHVMQDVVTGTALSSPQTGILFTDINPGFVQQNIVTGPGYNTPAPPSYAGNPYGAPIIEGIHVESVNGVVTPGGGPYSTVGCNTVEEINTGFYFGGDSRVTWINNIMRNNSYGYVLSGTIGDQLDPSTRCDNQWQTTGGFAWGTSLFNYQTYTMGSADPLLNRLFVQAGSTFFPSENGTEIANPYDPYVPSVIGLASSLPASCAAVPASSVQFKTAHENDMPTVTNKLDGQAYTLYPNPNDGKMNLQQLLPANEAVRAEIWDAIGKTVYNGNVNFENGHSQLQLANSIPGLYMLQLTDSNGSKFTLRFTIK